VEERYDEADDCLVNADEFYAKTKFIKKQVKDYEEKKQKLLSIPSNNTLDYYTQKE